MALLHVVTDGPRIGDQHVGSTGTHRDDSDTLRPGGHSNDGPPAV
jgi:hypothetical protein